MTSILLDPRRTVVFAGDSSPVVLMEPFLLPVKDGQHEWREDLDPKLEVVRKPTVEYGAILVPADD